MSESHSAHEPEDLAASAHPPISYKPTDGLTYDPSEPKYWEAGLLRKEIERAFDLCHGCRMCFKYCDRRA
ncbi:MAG: hypothetical protein NTV21_16915 [Planctomycetota bacterium]|nr:hypothetical protein [Planctomycetota bacterium]